MYLGHFPGQRPEKAMPGLLEVVSPYEIPMDFGSMIDIGPSYSSENSVDGPS